MLVLKSNKTPQSWEEADLSHPAEGQGGRGGCRAHLALGELPEHGSQAVVVHVAVGLDGHVEDVDGLLPGTLQGQGHVPIKSWTAEHPQPSGLSPKSSLTAEMLWGESPHQGKL